MLVSVAKWPIMANTNNMTTSEEVRLRRATVTASVTQLLGCGVYELIAVKLLKPEPTDRKSWFPARRHTYAEYRAGT